MTPRAGGALPQAVPRPRIRAYPEPRSYGYARPRVVIPGRAYPRPYYRFYPQYWIGFGLYVGVPVPYPVFWGHPAYVYGYPPYPYAYSYPYSSDLLIPNPEPGTYGGVSFDIVPPDASVSVDGVYVGIASDFSPTRQPLTLTPGWNHIELQAPGMIPLAFEVNVIAGEVVPYRGVLQPR